MPSNARTLLLLSIAITLLFSATTFAQFKRDLPFPRIEVIKPVETTNTTQSLCASYLKRPVDGYGSPVSQDSIPWEMMAPAGISTLGTMAIDWDEIDFAMIGRQFALKRRDSEEVYQFQLVGPKSPTNWQEVIIRDATTRTQFSITIRDLRDLFEHPYLVTGSEFKPATLWSEVAIVDRRWGANSGFGSDIDQQIVGLKRQISDLKKKSSRKQSISSIQQQVRLNAIDEALNSSRDDVSFLEPLEQMLEEDFFPLWETINDLRGIYTEKTFLEARPHSEESEEMMDLLARKEAAEVELGRYIEEHNSIFYHVYREGERAKNDQYKENFSRLLSQFEKSFHAPIPTLEEIAYFYRQSPIPTLAKLNDQLQLEVREAKRSLRAMFGLGFASETVPQISKLPEWAQRAYGLFSRHEIDRSSIIVFLDAYQQLKNKMLLLKEAEEALPHEDIDDYDPRPLPAPSPSPSPYPYPYPGYQPTYPGYQPPSGQPGPAPIPKQPPLPGGPNIPGNPGGGLGGVTDIPDIYGQDEPAEPEEPEVDQLPPTGFPERVERRPRLSQERREIYKELVRLIRKFSTEGPEALTFLYRITDDPVAVWAIEQLQLAEGEYEFLEIFPGFQEQSEKAKIAAANLGGLSITNLPAKRGLMARATGVASAGAGVTGAIFLSKLAMDKLGVSDLVTQIIAVLSGAN